MKTKHDYGDCSFCGGAVREKHVEVDYRWKGKIYIFRDVPAGVCAQCGERYYTASVAKAMERCVLKKTRPPQTLEVSIFSFAAD